MILASVHGEFRLWGSIGIGLAGGEHYTTTELPLQGDDGELLTTLTRIDVRYLLNQDLADTKLTRETRAKHLLHQPLLGDCSDLLWLLQGGSTIWPLICSLGPSLPCLSVASSLCGLRTLRQRGDTLTL